MDGSAIISALLLGLGCVKITLEGPEEALPSLSLLTCLHHLSWQVLQSVEDFKAFTEISLKAGSTHLDQY